MQDALFISLVGMGLVFIGLIALWVMMVVVVKLTNKKSSVIEKGNTVSTINDKDYDLECKQKVAAAAVTAVLALMNTSFIPSSHLENESMSPWQATHRSRQYSSILFPPRRKD
jgi:Na+-transporting methylmalonyl-CoA/oxaloacetate decarboxylase gamma subunit